MKTAVCLQVRLDSSRLPGKALLFIEDLMIVEHAMRALRNVDADLFLLLSTAECESDLLPLAGKWGFTFFAGPKEDVLARFVQAARHFGVTTLIRATGDNPLVSAKMANEVLEEHRRGCYDYSNWPGAPLGTGIEVVETEVLIEADANTDDFYDREHVTPWIYNNPNRFKLNIHPVVPKYSFPCKVSVDTEADLLAMREIFSHLYKGEPIEIDQLINYLKSWLLIPSTEEGNGMGHLKRMTDLAKRLGESARIFIRPSHKDRVLPAIPLALQSRIITEIGDPRTYGTIILDGRETDPVFFAKNLQGGNVIAIDEGGILRDQLPYILDILPLPGKFSQPNFQSLSFLGLPEPEERTESGKILVTFGGEDPAGLTDRFCSRMLRNNRESVDRVIIVLGPLYRGVQPDSRFEVLKSPEDLAGIISSCSGVICSYGLTAYEAVNQKIPLMLINPGNWHEELSALEGFPSAGTAAGDLKWERISSFIEKPSDFPPPLKNFSGPGLAEYLDGLGQLGVFCPLCGSESGSIEARFDRRTYRRCEKCGMLYLINYKREEVKYSSEYFFEQYKNQYGKTYLDDFPHIMKMAGGRIQRTSKWLSPGSTVLDVGCAYGPFLRQAEIKGYRPFGTDISPAAGEYVEKELGYPVKICRFEDFTIPDHWDISGFDLLTMWYVIEHFRDLRPVLSKVNGLLDKGGIFAFSTPNGNGISSRRDRRAFLERSPDDHYTVWEPEKSASFLKPYGFILEKIRVTGHHPERFPGRLALTSAGRMLNHLYSYLYGLGDTFEIYARKVRDI